MKQKIMASWLGILAVLLTACSTDAPAPSNKRDAIVVQITPAAQPAAVAIQACAAEIDTAVFRMVVRYPSPAEVDFLIRLGEPPEGASFMAQIASDQLGVVLHPDNTAASLTQEEIRALFSGQTASWAALGGNDLPVHVWVPLAGSEIRQAFEDKVMSGLPLAADAGLAPDAAAMSQAVSADPSAVGLIPASWGHNGPMVLLEMQLPVLVVADGTLEGPEVELAACLQGETGQAALSAIYP